MRLFREFQCRFIDDEGEVTGQKKYSFGRMKIDLLQVVTYNEAGNLTTVFLSNGFSYSLKIDYGEFDKLITEKNKYSLMNSRS